MSVTDLFDFSPFIDAVTDALETFNSLFGYVTSIANSFFNRVTNSSTFIFSFVVILFSIFVVSACITIWRH